MISLRLPRASEASHFLVMGDTGMGKSALIRQILLQIQQRGETAIIYDPALEFMPQFYSPERGDYILNPLDARCPYWTPADELTTTGVQLQAEALSIATSLFPKKPNDKNAYFVNRTRQLFAFLLMMKPTPQKLAYWMRTESELDRLVKGTQHASTLDKSAGPMRGGMIGELNTVSDTLHLLSEEKYTSQRWSIKQWEKERQGWLFLTSTPTTRESLKPLTSLWLDQLVLQLMTESKRPVWFVFNEFASLQRLEQAQTSLTENRKSNNPVIVDIQGRSQVEELYGVAVKTMLSQFATKFVFGTSDPDSNEWIANMIGKQEIERVDESHTGSKPASHRLIREEKYLAMPSEIGGLEPMHVLMKHRNLVVKMQIPWMELPKTCEAFVERVSVPVKPQPPIEFEEPVGVEQAFHR